MLRYEMHCLATEFMADKWLPVYYRHTTHPRQVRQRERLEHSYVRIQSEWSSEEIGRADMLIGFPL